MKRPFPCAPLILGGIFLTATAHGQLETGLVSYLQFESDASSSLPVDGIDGSLVLGAIAGSPGGIRDNALALDASQGNQHINLPLSYGEGTDLGLNFTISAWYNLNEFPADNGTSRYFIFEGESNFEISYGLRDSGVGEAGINDGQAFTGGGANTVIPDAALPGWQHVVQTYEENEGTVTIRTFVNGEEAAPLTRTAVDLVGTGINFGAARNTATNRGFDGLLDEVAVWNRTLSPDDVALAFLLGREGEAIAGDDPLDVAPEIVSFEATPSEVEFGGEVTLSWEVTGSTAVWLSGGIGLVDPASSEAVTVNGATTYTLLALNGNSPTTSSVDLEIVETQADLTDELVVYYPLDDGFANAEGASGPDASGVNGPMVGVPGGLVGNALQLSTPDNQHLNTPVSFGGEASDLGDSFTISAWYQLNEIPEANGSSRYFVFESSEGFDISYGLRDLGLGEPGINDGQTFTQASPNVSQNYADAAVPGWHQVVQRYVAADGTTTIETFIDGVSQGSIQNATLNISGTGINFGAPRSTVTNRGFDGLFDEIAIWSRPLSDGEIALSYELGSAGTGVIGSIAALTITGIDYNATTGVTSFDFVSSVGSTYAIDRSFDLEVWNEIEDNFQATSELSSFENGGAGPTAYYRVRRLN